MRKKNFQSMFGDASEEDCERDVVHERIGEVPFKPSKLLFLVSIEVSGYEEDLEATQSLAQFRIVAVAGQDVVQFALTVPTIRDRVVQTAAKLLLEPIFEADFDPNAYGVSATRA
jgi:hypothetical protein